MDAIDRRHLLALGGASALALLLGGQEAEAAVLEGSSICLYSRGGIARRARARPPSAKARGIVSAILREVDYRGTIQVMETRSISNAGAVPGRRGRPHTIIYNADFMDRLGQLHPAAPVAVFAHEIGHFTTTSQSAGNRWTRELTADQAGGCIMRRLGADVNGTTIALRALWSGGSRSHPDTPRRLRAVLNGYGTCVG